MKSSVVQGALRSERQWKISQTCGLPDQGYVLPVGAPEQCPESEVVPGCAAAIAGVTPVPPVTYEWSYPPRIANIPYIIPFNP